MRFGTGLSMALLSLLAGVTTSHGCTLSGDLKYRASNWGVVPMVPSEHVTLVEARAIWRWILELDQPSE
jgi:hypothetical protein